MKKNLIQFPFLRIIINIIKSHQLRFFLNPIQQVERNHKKEKKRRVQSSQLKINSNHKSSFHIVLITSTTPKKITFIHNLIYPNLYNQKTWLVHVFYF